MEEASFLREDINPGFFCESVWIRIHPVFADQNKALFHCPMMPAHTPVIPYFSTCGARLGNSFIRSARSALHRLGRAQKKICRSLLSTTCSFFQQLRFLGTAWAEYGVRWALIATNGTSRQGMVNRGAQ